MKAKLLQIEDGYVEFTTHIGVGMAKCRDTMIEKEKFYDIEFDFNKELNLGDDFEKISDTNGRIEFKGDYVFLTGTVEDVDEDDEVCLRLAKDCIMIFYQNPSNLALGDTIRVRLKKDTLVVSIVGR